MNVVPDSIDLRDRSYMPSVVMIPAAMKTATGYRVIPQQKVVPSDAAHAFCHCGL
jgi:hypothetical protein